MARGTRTIGNLTLRIKEAEVVESQLSPDDLKALRPETLAGVLCPVEYCRGGYVSDDTNDDIDDK